MYASAPQTPVEEQLAGHVARLARKTEALDDFAGLVAHDVRSTLLAALQDAVKAGWGVAGALKESDFDAVRHRADFQKLLAELEARRKANAP